MRVSADWPKVIFRNVSGVEQEVLTEKAAEFYAENQDFSPKFAIHKDGFRSYAKGWWDSRDFSKLVRIGAGAYGDSFVATF